MSNPGEFRWQLNWKILLFVALFLPITISLGFWQLDRSEQKREILADQQRQQNLAPLRASGWLDDRANHLRRVELVMELNPDRLLLMANRTIDGQVGYEVINQARIANANTHPRPQLVNRGWVPASLDREELPVISTPQGGQLVTGYYYCPEENDLIRQSTEFDGAWPAIVFSLDEAAIEQIFGAAERPLACEIRVDPFSPLAFDANWQIVNQSVEKHIGYAVQWFSMAFALIILALFSNSNLGSFFSSRET